MIDGPEIQHLPGFYEPFNAISHLAAAGVFTLLGWKLLRKRGNRANWPFLALYSVSCVFLLAMSAVFHMVVRGGAASRVMERLDHGAIFVLIAGTFTAVHGMVFRGAMRWVPLAVVWTFAAACITLKTVFFDSLPEWIGLSFYIGLGWGVGLTAIPVFRHRGFACVAPLLYGGLAYSIGALMDLGSGIVVIPGVVHAHEVWHVAVLVGALLQWRFVWNMAGDEAPIGAWRDAIGAAERTRRGDLRPRASDSEARARVRSTP